jgi:hypothetical protein
MNLSTLIDLARSRYATRLHDPARAGDRPNLPETTLYLPAAPPDRRLS